MDMISDEDFRRLNHLWYDFKGDMKEYYEYRETIPIFINNQKEILQSLKLKTLVEEQIKNQFDFLDNNYQNSALVRILTDLLERSKNE